MKKPIARIALALSPALIAGCAAAPPPQPQQTQQNNTGASLFSLYQQIQHMQQQIRNLNGQVDTLQYQLKQQQKGQGALYQNIDKRLSALEHNAANNANTTGNVGSGSAPNGSAGENENATSNDNGNAGASQPPQAGADAQSAYQAAFDKLKAGQYDASIGAFKQFIQQYPNTNLTGNAWYWLGQSYYVQQDLNDSQNAFENVVNNFPSSDKTAGSLYQLGVIYAAQNKPDKAKAIFQRVVSQYPQSDVASQAKNKLASPSSSN